VPDEGACIGRNVIDAADTRSTLAAAIGVVCVEGVPERLNEDNACPRGSYAVSGIDWADQSTAVN